ncbi:MAG: hypothetical protein ABJZ55_14850 [Fuerstiella sp.]
MLDRYDFQRTWLWNLKNSPTNKPFSDVHVPQVSESWNYLGRPTNSCLGIPAGPLLNADWLLYYSRLGFDILTYKTVRTTARDCYPLPNLVPVFANQLPDSNQTVLTAETMQHDWAVSFGMPSVAASQWKADVRKAKNGLASGQLLVVSIVGEASSAHDDSVNHMLNILADDYATCAKWAVESGADVVEANFSCPNVCSTDGQLYQRPDQAVQVASRIRDAIGDVPLVLKIGFYNDISEIEQFLDAVAPYVQGLCMTNSIAAKVVQPTHVRQSNTELFDGQVRGICGRAIHVASVRQVQTFCDLIRRKNLTMDVSAVGGIFDADDVQRYLDAGAATVGMATSAMRDPMTAIRIRRQWANGSA